MKHKKVFIVITHIQQMDKGKAQLVEKCEFVDSIKDRHIYNASVILDYLKEMVVKNRSKEGTYHEFEQYVKKEYPQQMKELYEEYKKED